MLTQPRMHGALLVATGVATAEDFERCRALGFSYFKGDFFAKPRLVTHRGVGTGGVSSLRALGELSASDASFEDLERIISPDVWLSLKLLRYERGQFPSQPPASDPDVSLSGVYRAALEWADEAGRAVAG